MRLRNWLVVKRDYVYLRLLLWSYGYAFLRLLLWYYDSDRISRWTWRLDRKDGRWHLGLHVDLADGGGCRDANLDSESGAVLAHAFLDFMQTVTS